MIGCWGRSRRKTWRRWAVYTRGVFSPPGAWASRGSPSWGPRSGHDWGRPSKGKPGGPAATRCLLKSAAAGPCNYLRSFSPPANKHRTAKQMANKKMRRKVQIIRSPIYHHTSIYAAYLYIICTNIHLIFLTVRRSMRHIIHSHIISKKIKWVCLTALYSQYIFENYTRAAISMSIL